MKSRRRVNSIVGSLPIVIEMRVTLVLVALVLATTIFSSNAIAQQRQRFESYAVRGKFSGVPAPVNLRSHPKARLFRTMLREGAKTGPNFAGYYTIVHWGCGSDCRMIAVVDCRNGHVYFAPFVVSPSFGQDFRINSRLFIVNPPERSGYKDGEPMMDQYLPSWHVWRAGRFVQLWPKHKRCGTCF
jgi:hypothetical protein